MNDFKKLQELTEYHRENCKLYSDFVDSYFIKNAKKLEDLPFLPVRAFKEFDLLSIARENVFKIMLSSGTTGVQSKIFLDKENAKMQSFHLTESFKNSFGNSRFTMLIIDSSKVAKGRTARTAAINGFSMYSKRKFFALDDDMNLDLDGVLSFLSKNRGEKIFIFGFTYIVYQYFIKVLAEKNIKLDLSNSFLVHGGGWKKLEKLKISDELFKESIRSQTNCVKIHNYYGMIEQTGSIYFECLNGNLHAPHNGDVLVRNFKTLKVNDYGEEGFIQVFSTIQTSYPGHSLLTEDVGCIFPHTSCRCGNRGKVLKIIGRLKDAEIRGCSDAVL